MSYPQFGYSPFPPTTQLMVGTSVSSNASSVSSPCCGESGRGSGGVSTDAQATVLPATYDSRLLSPYPRLAPSGFYTGPSPYGDHPYPNFTGVDSSAFYPSLSTPYGMKDGSDPWRGIAPSASYYYDPSLAAYGYGGLDFNGARRKNVTRDSTSTLKAWLNEHRKNPYPTKGEKIMLAIITKMTLTQVSTWFANARRRLKKENKMTWEPRNKMDSEDVKDFEEDDDCDKGDKGDCQKETSEDNSSDIRGGGRDGSGCGSVRGCQPSSRADRDISDDSDDCGQHMTSADNSVDGVLQFRPDDVFLNRAGYGFLRHAQVMPNGFSDGRCRQNSVLRNDHQTMLPSSDFSSEDSSATHDVRNLIRSSEENSDAKHSPGSALSGAGNAPGASGDLNDLSATSSKPKIWSLADTATSKTPPVASVNVPRNEQDGGSGTVADMIGHCGWFSVNPYQVNASSSFGGYHHHHGPAFVPPNGSGAGASGSVFSNGSGSGGGGVVPGFSPIPPQTDTPPQTPPNMKMANGLSLGSCNYIAQSAAAAAAHLYAGQSSGTISANGALSSVVQGKPGSGYTGSQRPPANRSHRTESMPEDYSNPEPYRASAIQ